MAASSSPRRLSRPSKSCSRRISRRGKDDAFLAEFDRLLAHYVGRPTPVYEAARLRASLPKPAARMFLKREDLAHTGAHKINNALGQALLAKRMGKTRVIAETGAGQHGVATATVCALLGLECHVYMGTDDMARQALNVVRMRLLGATVRGVSAGSRTLKDAINEAMRDWVTNVTDSYYLLGSVLGPHPYPLMVREFQSVIGREAREQIQKHDRPAARCRRGVRRRRQQRARHFRCVHSRQIRAADRRRGRRRGARPPDVMPPALRRGSRACCRARAPTCCRTSNGNIELTHSISAGLDYAAVGPEHAWLRDMGRAEYSWIGDERRARGVSAACANRRHHSGARVVARDRVRDARSRRSSGRTRRS